MTSDGEKPVAPELRIVRRILRDIKGRAGLADVWDSIDDATAVEIVATWERLVREELDQ